MAFNPGITDRRADFAYQGAAAFGAGIAGGINQLGDVFGGAMQEQIAARDESEALRDSLVFAGEQGYAPVTPEMLEQFDSGNLKAKREMFATTMAMAEMENKRALSQENMDYNAMRTRETSDYAAQVRAGERAAITADQAARETEVLDALIRDKLRSGEIDDAQAERARAVGQVDPAAGRELLETISAVTGPAPVPPPDYQPYEVPGIGTIIRDDSTGREVSTSRIVKPEASATTAPAGPALLDPNNPTAIPTPNAAPGQPPGMPLGPLNVDWFFGR